MSNLLDKPLFESKPITICDDQWFIQRQRQRPVRAMPHLRSVDDRRKWCTICEDIHANLKRRRIRNAYIDPMSAGAIRRAVVFGLVVFLLTSVVAFSLQSLNGGDAPLWTIVPIPIWLAWLITRILKSQWRATICAAIHEHHCPGCDYSLADLETGDDDCTLCPECGTAWILPPTQPKPVSHVADA